MHGFYKNQNVMIISPPQSIWCKIKSPRLKFSFFFVQEFKKPNEIKSATKKTHSAKREKRVKTASHKSVRQLLGELYADKVYLEKLLDDDSNIIRIFI
jgi:hypothetical protein